jgi:hypothetical protein
MASYVPFRGFELRAEALGSSDSFPRIFGVRLYCTKSRRNDE